MSTASTALWAPTTTAGLAGALRGRIIGQRAAIDAIVPYVASFRARLNPDGRPAGVFLLLGPTGTGKTRTVQALAEVLHGSPKKLLRVDCGEYQMEHEVAKLIGAPPGYLGHRETAAALSRSSVTGAASEECSLSLVLFDEIEKAAPSMKSLLLGVLDRGTLRLGDATTVDFTSSLIFLTSNLGAKQMVDAGKGYGLGALSARRAAADQIERIGAVALRKHFAPEFINRLDEIVTYQALTDDDLETILDLEIETLRRLVAARLGAAMRLDVSGGARRLLLKLGTSIEFGARELKRVLQQKVMQPLAALVAAGAVEHAAAICVVARGETFRIQVIPHG